MITSAQLRISIMNNIDGSILTNSSLKTKKLLDEVYYLEFDLTMDNYFKVAHDKASLIAQVLETEVSGSDCSSYGIIYIWLNNNKILEFKLDAESRTILSKQLNDEVE